MSGKRPKGSLYACRELMAIADSLATVEVGGGLKSFTPCPEPNEDGSGFKFLNTISTTGYMSRSSDRGINPNALHRLGFMPRKHLHQVRKSSLGTGSGESFTPRTPSPLRQERVYKGSALGFSARRARGLGIVTRQGQDKTALPFWLGSLANRARKAPIVSTTVTPQSFD